MKFSPDCCKLLLKLQAAFAGSVGQRLDAAVITIMAAIEGGLA